MCSSPEQPERIAPAPVTAPPPPTMLETGAADVAANRNRNKGIRGLRIDKTAAAPTGGSGLNIPT